VSRVLLVCPEPLGHGHPAGVGIRFLEMQKVLAADGHRVTLLSPPIAPDALLQQSNDADVAVVQGHIANDFFAHARAIPTVVDLYDPFIVENLHYYESRGAEVFHHDHTTVLNSLQRGDFFLCASKSQRLFWLGMMLGAGRLNPLTFDSDPSLDSLIATAPFGVPPPRQRPAAAEPRVLFGGIYDWYDPILAIDAIALARESLPSVSLTFNKHPNPSITPQGKTAEAMEYVKRKRYEAFIRFEPWFEYERRGEFFDRFAIALLTFPQSLETELSMRTRVYDFLWAGLPIVSSAAPGTDELLARYGCGVTVDSNSPRAFADAVLQTFAKQAALRTATQRFVAEHQWPEALKALREFCREPRIDANKDAFAVRMQIPERPASILERLKRRIGGAS
jgi:glycosyltransferase involved in cell wall biosynthesis